MSEEQTNFIASRSILDGPVILSKIMAWLKYSKNKGLFFKIDFEKAYDMVSWAFLDSILVQMGFPTMWRAWIRNCLKSSQMSIIVNGSPTLEFGLTLNSAENNGLFKVLGFQMVAW